MTRCFAGRSQLLGDSISSLPLLNLVKNRYSDSEITYPVAKKCQSQIPFIQNHKLIDHILVSDDEEGNIYTIDGKTYNQQTDKLPFDFQINCNPPARGNWYNEDGARLVKENCLMAGFSSEEFDSLPENEKIPKLYWDRPIIKSKFPAIIVHGFAGYGGGNKRCPSEEWWKNLLSILGEKYYLIQIGHPAEPDLGVSDIRGLNLIEQFDYVCGADLYLGVEGGLAWINGGLGIIPQINLMTYHFPGHNSNPESWMPQSQLGNEINLFELDDINNISHDLVISSIESLLKT